MMKLLHNSTAYSETRKETEHVYGFTIRVQENHILVVFLDDYNFKIFVLDIVKDDC